MKMTMTQHLTMFLTITDTIRANYHNLTEKEIADLGTNITNAIIKSLDIEIEKNKAEEDLIVKNLVAAFLIDVLKK